MKPPRFVIGAELEGSVFKDRHMEFWNHVRTIKGYEDVLEGHDSVDRPIDHQCVEVRTTPLPIAAGRNALDELLDYMNSLKDDFQTPDGAGFHFNISEAGMRDYSYDEYYRYYDHLTTHFPEWAIFDRFPTRANSSWCLPIYARTAARDGFHKLSYVQRGGYKSIRPQYFGPDYQVVHKPFSSANGQDVDGKPENTRFEFRLMGDRNYHKKLKELQASIDDIVSAMTKAHELSQNDKRTYEEISGGQSRPYPKASDFFAKAPTSASLVTA